jgi:hypothetical protein
MTTTKGAYIGVWRISHTDLWDREDLDLVEEAHISFRRGGQGELVICALHATIDWELRGKHAEFSFQGFDDGTEVTGRGYAQVAESDKLHGRLNFHLGDKPTFRAEKKS